MTTLQQQARALGDPTRHGIFRYVADAGRDVGVAELTDHFGLNHNAIRQHLAKLVDAGLLEVGKVPTGGRGRPRLSYGLAPGAEARWGAEAPYERLSHLLAEMVRTGDAPVEVGRRSGVQTVAEGHDGDPVAALVKEMARHGFDPVVTADGERVELELRTCPFESTAVADPLTVCGLHLGIARGVADAVGGLVIDELEPHDPVTAGCRLRCHRTTGEPSAAAAIEPRE